MNRVVLKDRFGRSIIFEQDTLSTLPVEEMQRLVAGESVMYHKKEYRFKRQATDGTWYYDEYVPWMALHPLVQLDQQLRGKS